MRTGDLLAQELSRSEKFARKVERLRAEDQRDRRAMPQFTEFADIEAMQAHVAAERARPRRERTWKWSEDRVYTDCFDPAPSDPCDALNRQQRELQTTGFHFFGASSAANRLLDFLRGGMLGIPGAIASLAMTDAVASCTTARVHGLEWGSARRANITFTRHVDVQLDNTWYFCKSLDGDG